MSDSDNSYANADGPLDVDSDESEEFGGERRLRDMISGFVPDYEYDFNDRTLYKNTVCLFNVPHLSDVTFLIRDENMPSKPLKPIFAHRLILSSCSEVFRHFFLKTKSRAVTVSGVRFQHFLHIIRYIYVGWVEDLFPTCEATEFMNVVKRLGLESMFQWQLRTWLMNAVRKASDSPVCIYISAIELNYRDIMRECICTITDNPKKAFKDMCFEDLTYKGILHLVSIKHFNCTDYEIMRALDRWIMVNGHNYSEDQIELLYHTVETNDYRYKGKRYRLHADVGYNISDHIPENVIEMDHILEFEVFQPEKKYEFSETFDICSHESMYIYGIVVLFGKHRDHDHRFIESHYSGEITIKFGDIAIVNEHFDDTIFFNEETFKATEIFFPTTCINHNHQYTVEITWRTVGAYPDALTFEVQSNDFMVDGNCFISELFCDFVNVRPLN